MKNKFPYFESLKNGDIFYRPSKDFKIEKVVFISMDNKLNRWYKFNAWFYINDKNNIEFINYEDFINTCFLTEREVIEKILFKLLSKYMTINTDYMNQTIFNQLKDEYKKNIKKIDEKKRELIFEISNCDKKIKEYLKIGYNL